MWNEAQEVAAILAAQIGEATLATMTRNAIAKHVRKDMPGESHQVQANVTEALEIIRDDIRR